MIKLTGCNRYKEADYSEFTYDVSKCDDCNDEWGADAFYTDL